MRVGFTGTRFGMTEAQLNSFSQLMCNLNPDKFHHGDCVGADDNAANETFSLFGKDRTVCHPPIDESHRAFNPHYSEIRKPKTHFARNRDIVNETDVLIACPKEDTHQDRGGTWYTVDFAMKVGKMVYTIWPDGRIEEPGSRKNPLRGDLRF